MMFEVGGLVCMALVCAWIAICVVAYVVGKRLRLAIDEGIEEVHATAVSRSGEMDRAASEMEIRVVEALQRVQAKAETIEKEVESIRLRCPCYVTDRSRCDRQRN